MGFDPPMYRVTFRILESLDEHFYSDRFSYHWSYSGLGLEPALLERLYRANALAVRERAARNATAARETAR